VLNLVFDKPKIRDICITKPKINKNEIVPHPVIQKDERGVFAVIRTSK
jgi:hypothetical protein